MKVTLITAVLNRKDSLQRAIESVFSQKYNDIEYIIIDGGSTDGSVEIIKKFEPIFNNQPGKKLQWISEHDDSLYEALNKGIKMATGDIIGIMNSDDFYFRNDVIDRVISELSEPNVEAIYGDVCYVSRFNTSKVIRYYSSKSFNNNLFCFGFMPAHPSFFTFKKYYEQFGAYKANYKISGDFELLLRFLKIHKLKAKYVNFNFLKMLDGGSTASSLKNRMIVNHEILRACKENNVFSCTPMIYLRYIIKICQIYSFRITKLFNKPD